MKRRIFTILAALSLALWIAAAVLTIFCHSIDFETVGISFSASEDAATVMLRSSDPQPPLGNFNGTSVYFGTSGKFKIIHESTLWHLPGIVHFKRWESKTNGSSFKGWQGWTITYWWPLLMFAVLPSLCLVRFNLAYRKRRRTILGLCMNCGYDLRASKDRCPECGTAIPASTVKRAIA